MYFIYTMLNLLYTLKRLIQYTNTLKSFQLQLYWLHFVESNFWRVYNIIICCSVLPLNTWKNIVCVCVCVCVCVYVCEFPGGTSLQRHDKQKGSSLAL